MLAAAQRWRRPAIALAVVAIAVFARWHWDRLTGPQTPRENYDSRMFFEIVQRPLDLQQFYYMKPPFVPLVYRLVGKEPTAIIGAQTQIAFAAWSVLAIAAAGAMRSGWARAMSVAIAVAFLLAAPRVGWTGAVLSESINDSLTVLVMAGVLALTIPQRAHTRTVLAIATGLVSCAWIFTRDTNAISALVATVVAAVVWSARRWWRDARWAVPLAGVIVVAAVFSLWSTRVVPDRPLPIQDDWHMQLTARGAGPLINNLRVRVFPSDRAWLAERGAPVDELSRLGMADEWSNLAASPASKAWIAEHGASTYLRWLLRHPIDRAVQLIRGWHRLLAGNNPGYMPPAWIAHDDAHPVVEALRQLTANRWVLLALLALAPLALRRPRAQPACGLALCVIASGIAGSIAAYFGDSIEINRHCYGAAQQVVLGLFFAHLAWLDRRRARTATPLDGRGAMAPPGYT